MPSFGCFKLRREFGGRQAAGFDDFIEFEDHSIQVYGPIDGPDFRAMAYIQSSALHEVPWSTFLREGFGEDLPLPRTRSLAAVLVVQIQVRNREEFFAMVFGVGGRYLLKANCWERGYGLRTALNLIYPRSGLPAEEEGTRLLGVDTKRRGSQIV